MSLRSIHIVGCVRMSSLLEAGEDFIVCTYTLGLSIYPSTDTWIASTVCLLQIMLRRTWVCWIYSWSQAWSWTWNVCLFLPLAATNSRAPPLWWDWFGQGLGRADPIFSYVFVPISLMYHRHRTTSPNAVSNFWDSGQVVQESPALSVWALPLHHRGASLFFLPWGNTRLKRSSSLGGNVHLHITVTCGPSLQNVFYFSNPVFVGGLVGITQLY